VPPSVPVKGLQIGAEKNEINHELNIETAKDLDRYMPKPDEETGAS
jgi:hypothetical protein